MKKKILVTGGCGFIGSHTITLLLKMEFQIVVIDSNVNSSIEVLDKIKLVAGNYQKKSVDNLVFYKGDLRDFNFLDSVFKKEYQSDEEIIFVIHFAGLKSVSDSNDIPINYWDNNIFGTINLLKIMEKYNCRNIIFSSSATVYDSKEISIFKEIDSTYPSNPYGNTKLAIEKMLRDVFESSSSKWKIACLRYFNPVGAHQSGLLGEDPKGTPNNIFPILNNVAAGCEKIFKVFGGDWETEDGTCVRDYIHVLDVAEGHLKTLEHLLNGSAKFLILNIGTGKGTSVLQLIKAFEKVNAVRIPFIITKRRKGDRGVIVADNDLSKEMLNWIPKLTLEDMCRDAWRWKQLNPKGY